MPAAVPADNEIDLPDPGQSPDPAQWLAQHGDALYAFALLRVREASAAEDLVQDTLLAALGARQGFRAQSSERTWLTGILKHKVLDYYRKRAREQGFGADEKDLVEMNADFFDEDGFWLSAPSAWRQPDRALEQEQFWEQFSTCLDKLPERLRLLYLLKEVDGMGTDEVIRDLNLSSPNNLWTMLSRTRLQLRSCLEKNWFGR